MLRFALSLSFVVSFVAVVASAGEKVECASPDGKVRAVFSTDADVRLVRRLTRDGTVVPRNSANPLLCGGMNGL